MVRRRRLAPLVVALMATVLVGCAGEGGAMGPSTSPQPPVGRETGRPEPPPVVPTLGPPSRPPREPSDPRPRNVLVGQVTKGGTGPCYGLVTDDGRQYALHSTAGLELEEGAYVEVRVEPLRLKIYCGPGQHLALVSATKV